MRRIIILTVTALVLAAAPGAAGWEEGVAAFQSRDYAEAARHFKELTDQRSDCTACFLMYGQSLLKLDRSQEAVTVLRKAYDLDPSDNSIRLPLAQAYLQEARYGDAVQLLSTIDSDELEPAKRQAFYQMRALALEKSGRSDEVIGDLQRAAESNPNDAAAQYRYGVSCLSAQDSDCAISALQKAVRLDGSEPAYKRALTKAYLLKGRQSQRSSKQSVYRQAAEVAGELVASSSTYENLLLLGEAQLGAKRYSAAAETFQRAAQNNTSDWLPLFYVGQAQTATGEYGSAESALKRALDRTSSSQDETRIWRQLAFVYEKQKSYDDAIAAYRKVGDERGVERVQENKRIAEENRDIEEYNEQIQELEEERKRLEEEMQDLPPDLR